MGVLLWDGRRKLGGAHRLQEQLVPQFESEIPCPLGHDLPGFLSPGRVATPAIGLLFNVFVFQRRFKSAAMEVERRHIRGGEGAWGRFVKKSS